MREILKAQSLKDALELKNKQPEATYLSGGSEVLRLNSPIEATAPIIDISTLIPDKITKQNNNQTQIGAGATFQEIIESPNSPAYLKEACHLMASFSLRQQATIGGNIASRRDDSHLIPILIATGATLEVLNKKGEKVIKPIEDYLGKKDCPCIILSVIIPTEAKAKTRRFARSAMNHSALNVAVGPHAVAAAVRGTGILMNEEEMKKATFTDDLSGSGEYKKYLLNEAISILKEEVEK